MNSLKSVKVSDGNIAIANDAILSLSDIPEQDCFFFVSFVTKEISSLIAIKELNETSFQIDLASISHLAEYTLSLVDMLGRVIATRRFTGSENDDLTVSFSFVPKPGVLVLYDTDGKVVQQKMIAR